MRLWCGSGHTRNIKPESAEPDTKPNAKSGGVAIPFSWGLGYNWIQPDRWAKYRKDFEKRAQELLAGLSKLYAEHEGDLRAAGYLKATGER